MEVLKENKQEEKLVSPSQKKSERKDGHVAKSNFMIKEWGGF